MRTKLGLVGKYLLVSFFFSFFFILSMMSVEGGKDKEGRKDVRERERERER